MFDEKTKTLAHLALQFLDITSTEDEWEKVFTLLAERDEVGLREFIEEATEKAKG